MGKRIVSLSLAFVVGFVFVFGFLPLRSYAIFPIGVMQSALATYVTSTGYKMWQDQGTGSDLLASIGQLYDDFVTVMSAAGTSVPTLEQLDQDGQVAVDNSGNWIYYHDAAQTFQSFADWAQSHYNITVGDSQPTVVISGDTLVSDSDGRVALKLPLDSVGTSPDSGNPPVYYHPVSYAYRTSDGTALYFGSRYQGCIAYFTTYSGRTYSALGADLRDFSLYYFNSSGTMSVVASEPLFNTFSTDSLEGYATYHDLPECTVSPQGVNWSSLVNTSSSNGLALSLAQSVADHIADSFSADDAVVIGVGAAAGTDAETLADISAQGILAGDLTTDVTITAADVIDTPVQPYPDIDGLGLPSLGAALVSRFPFCVPWDFVDTLKILNADPVPPVFDVTLVPDAVASRWGVSGNYTLHVDLTSPQYAKLFVALRWGTLVGFCISLALLTKRLIWTA